jgi:hypothetical protein
VTGYLLQIAGQITIRPSQAVARTDYYLGAKGVQKSTRLFLFLFLSIKSATLNCL